MAYLTADQIKENIVIPSLRKVADFSGDPSAFNFQSFQPFHKKVFLSALKTYLNEHPYITDDPGQANSWFYDVVLNDNSLGNWNTVQDCINWFADNHGASPTPTRRKVNF